MAPVTTRGEIRQFASYVALLYHEARNVRHLVLGGVVKVDRYRKLISLPKNKEEAWKQLQSVRLRAEEASSAEEVSEIFQKHFSLTLREIVELSENRHWRGHLYGGNRWSAIGRVVIELKEAIDTNSSEDFAKLLTKLEGMQHNTGIVGDKLKFLEQALLSLLVCVISFFL
jgi:hypothetical protein